MLFLFICTTSQKPFKQLAINKFPSDARRCYSNFQHCNITWPGYSTKLLIIITIETQDIHQIPFISNVLETKEKRQSRFRKLKEEKKSRIENKLNELMNGNKVKDTHTHTHEIHAHTIESNVCEQQYPINGYEVPTITIK